MRRANTIVVPTSRDDGHTPRSTSSATGSQRSPLMLGATASARELRPPSGAGRLSSEWARRPETPPAALPRIAGNRGEVGGPRGRSAPWRQPAEQAIWPVQARFSVVPSAGFEPAHTAPEADALSPELRGHPGPLPTRAAHHRALVPALGISISAAPGSCSAAGARRCRRLPTTRPSRPGACRRRSTGCPLPR